MNTTRFQKATKHEAKLRLALIGPAGTGKTYSALTIATHLVPDARIAVIDTERGSASKYADLFAFDVCELERHSPTDYVAAIRSAEAEGYAVIVIDSLSHAWSGRGGALELVDMAAKRSRNPNTFGAWREVTPLHNEMVDAILSVKAHVIVTMRSKTEWVQEQDERGKTRIRKVGMAPVQRDGLEYEFDVVGDLDQDHNLVVTKTRCATIANALVSRPGQEFAQLLREWLAGNPRTVAAVAEPVAAPATNHREPSTEKSENVGNYITVLPKGASAKPLANAEKLQKLLTDMQIAETEQDLLLVGKAVSEWDLSQDQTAIARKAYSNRLAELKRRAKLLQLLRQQVAESPKETIDELGIHGIILDSVQDIDLIPDDALDIVEKVVLK